MANPALKNGYLSVALELVDKFAEVNIPGNEMRIVWVVWRYTWGWEGKQEGRRKDWDTIAFSQFLKATKMKNGNVSRSLESLVAKRLLLVSEKGYRFNQDYDQWLVAKRLPNKPAQASSQKATKPVAKKLPISSQKATKTVAKRRVSKENNESKEKQKAKDEPLRAIPAGTLTGEEWQKLIDLFEPVNPTHDLIYKNKTERAALTYLVKKYGFEKTCNIVAALPEICSKPYAPKITKPTELRRDLGKLLLFVKQEGNKDVGKSAGKVLFS